MRSKLFFPILLCVLSLIPLLDFLNPGLPITHDGQDHVARIANFYQNLQQGVLIPRWAAHLNWGYGHPILMFLYPLPSYFASLFHAIGFSFVDSTKLVFALSFILSGLCIYLWLQNFLPKPAAFAGGLLYLFPPYRFIDLYVRGDIGESLAFIFPPLILYFFYRLSQKKSYYNVLGGALSLAALILSHNAVSIIFLPLTFFYIMYLTWLSKSKKYIPRNTLYVILLGFCLSAFFWVPAFFEGKYTLRDTVTKGGYLNNFVNFPALLYGKWNYGLSGQFSVQIGILQWISILTSLPLLLWLFRKKEKDMFFLVGLLIFFFGAIFIMLPQSRFIWDRFTLLQKFQFPWRFLSLCVFTAAVCGAYVFSVIPKKWQKPAVIVLVIAILSLNKNFWHAQGFLQKPEIFYTGTYTSTTDTGESAPIWSVRFMEHLPKAHFEVISGNVSSIVEKKHTSTVHEYIVNATKKSQLRENTLYFPGWEVLVDKRLTAIQYQDPNSRGIMTFFVPAGSHTIIVQFQETKLRVFADVISLLSIVSIVIVASVSVFRNDKKSLIQ